MKRCCVCKLSKDLSVFHKNSSKKDGKDPRCKVCKKEKSHQDYKVNNLLMLEKQKRYYKTNKEKVLKYQEEYRKNNKDKVGKYYNINRSRLLKKQKNHYKNNKELYLAQNAKRRAQKLNATLEGYDKEIKEIYKNCPDGHHVDHIMPLNNPIICGLHVPWNLQYLTAKENLKKSNKFDKNIKIGVKNAFRCKDS